MSAFIATSQLDNRTIRRSQTLASFVSGHNSTM